MRIEGLFGAGSRGCMVVAEVALAHDGSLGMAHAYVDAVADAGVDAVKFQTHIAEAESTLDEPWRVPFSTQDVSRYDYWRRTAFSEAEWRELSEHAAERGIDFLSSPFSPEAVDLLVRLGVPAMKIASGEVGNPELREAVVSSGLPVLLSRGLATLAELDEAVGAFRSAGTPLAVLQCTSEYPAPPERWGLGALAGLRERYGCPIGFSDHSGTVYAGVAAAALGASLVEVHVVFDRRSFGPDSKASLTPDEIASLVSAVRDVTEAAVPRPELEPMTADLERMRALFGRSWAPATDLAAGTFLERPMLRLKKPGSGIPFDELGSLLGRRLARDVTADRLLRPEDVE